MSSERVGNICLSISDKEDILAGCELNDKTLITVKVFSVANFLI
jgi:hypothetical protein